MFMAFEPPLFFKKKKRIVCRILFARMNIFRQDVSDMYDKNNMPATFKLFPEEKKWEVTHTSKRKKAKKLSILWTVCFRCHFFSFDKDRVGCRGGICAAHICAYFEIWGG